MKRANLEQVRAGAEAAAWNTRVRSWFSTESWILGKPGEPVDPLDQADYDQIPAMHDCVLVGDYGSSPEDILKVANLNCKREIQEHIVNTCPERALAICRELEILRQLELLARADSSGRFLELLDQLDKEFEKNEEQ